VLGFTLFTTGLLSFEDGRSMAILFSSHSSFIDERDAFQRTSEQLFLNIDGS